MEVWDEYLHGLDGSFTKSGYYFGGPCNKDYSIGYPNFGKLSYCCRPFNRKLQCKAGLSVELFAGLGQLTNKGTLFLKKVHTSLHAPCT